ncbi:MAG: transposase [Planctomycetaceae bacterium]|jgi:IS5 family transposase|nr:transposase [Planctomycetaceae bacterium]
MDGTFIEVPRQRNTKAENAQIKKGDENHFGYKNHIQSDVYWKIIWGYGVMAASVHDSNIYLDFYPAKTAEDKAQPQTKDDRGYADSAYIHHEDELRKRGYAPQICERAYRNKPLMGGIETE